MSFFGFDTSLPPDDRERALAQGHNTQAPGFSQQYDAFAGLSGRGLEQEDQGLVHPKPIRPFILTEALRSLDFDDTYDGLGDRLEESGDAFNDDTFGDGPATQDDVGRDFDFFGNTANVAQAMREEQMRFDAGRIPPKLSPQKKPTKPARTGYEGYIPQLEAQSSLWGLPKKSPEPAPSQSQAPARRVMTLEEIEASMRAQRPQAPKADLAAAMPQMPPPQNPAQFGVFGVPGFEPPADLYFHQQQLQQVQQMQQQQPSFNQAPQILQRPQQRQPQPQQAELPAQGIQHPQILQRQRPVQQQPPAVAHRPTPPQQTPTVPPQDAGPPVQPRQILQNPNRLSGQGLRVQGGPVQQPVEVLQRRSPATPGHQRGSSYQGPIITNPQQILQLSEEDKAAFLLEEAKRAKRNHKIALMAKYNGLMTPQDKNFISRIQLSQLLAATNSSLEDQNPDDKFADDFYYNVYSQIRSAGRQNPNEPANKFAQTYLFQTGGRYGHGRRFHRGGDNSMQRMEQQVQRAVEAAKARPKTTALNFEGSLGKISFSNAKTPRPLLSIKREESQQQQRPHTPARRPSQHDAAAERRAVLRTIETIYASLMKMEDHERRLPSIASAPTEDARVAAHVEWRNRLQQLHTQLWTDLKIMEPLDPASGFTHPFIALLSHAKGMKLIPRVWRHIDEKERLTAVTMIMVHLDALDVIAKAVPTAEMLEAEAPSLPSVLRDEIELFLATVSQSLFATVQESDMSVVLGLLALALERATPRTLVLTKVGLCVLTMLISRLEVLKNGAAVPPSPGSLASFNDMFARLLDATEPVLPFLFVSANGSVRDADDFHVWQFLAAMGASANAEQQARLVVGVKERVMETVRVSRALPNDVREQRLGVVNLFMKAIGLDVGLLD